jgi:hypothetical protein
MYPSCAWTAPCLTLHGGSDDDSHHSHGIQYIHTNIHLESSLKEINRQNSTTANSTHSHPRQNNPTTTTIPVSVSVSPKTKTSPRFRTQKARLSRRKGSRHPRLTVRRSVVSMWNCALYETQTILLHGLSCSCCMCKRSGYDNNIVSRFSDIFPVFSFSPFLLSHGINWVKKPACQSRVSHVQGLGRHGRWTARVRIVLLLSAQCYDLLVLVCPRQSSERERKKRSTHTVWIIKHPPSGDPSPGLNRA